MMSRILFQAVRRQFEAWISQGPDVKVIVFQAGGEEECYHPNQVLRLMHSAIRQAALRMSKGQSTPRAMSTNFDPQTWRLIQKAGLNGPMVRAIQCFNSNAPSPKEIKKLALSYDKELREFLTKGQWSPFTLLSLPRPVWFGRYADARRYVYFDGRPDAIERFIKLSNDAGRLILEAKNSFKKSVHPQSLADVNPSHRWVYSLFDWTMAADDMNLPIRTERRIVDRSGTEHTYSREHFRSMLMASNWSPKAPDWVRQWAEKLPDRWHCQLDAAFRASIYALSAMAPKRTDATTTLKKTTKSGQEGVGSVDEHPLAYSKLRLDSHARIAKWGRHKLTINSHADYAVLEALCKAQGALVEYATLLHAVKKIESKYPLKQAPQEVKEAISRINRAFRQIPGCLVGIRNLRSKGYRLHLTNE